MDDREQRIRQRAHQIWLDEGSPEGRSRDHWETAEAAIDAEDAVAALAPMNKPAKPKAERGRSISDPSPKSPKPAKDLSDVAVSLDEKAAASRPRRSRVAKPKA